MHSFWLKIRTFSNQNIEEKADGDGRVIVCITSHFAPIINSVFHALCEGIIHWHS